MHESAMRSAGILPYQQTVCAALCSGKDQTVCAALCFGLIQAGRSFQCLPPADLVLLEQPTNIHQCIIYTLWKVAQVHIVHDTHVRSTLPCISRPWSIAQVQKILNC